MRFSKQNISALLLDIRFWIFLFFIIRLYGIWFAPLEISHNWRQTTVTMVARNFLEIDPNPLYPRLDIAGEKTGITGMEFPILNYLIYMVSLIFGYQHWYGRLIVLIVSSIGIAYFHRLCLKYFNKEIAFKASIILLFSIWYTYSRKIMPDTFSMSLIVMALYYGLFYLENGKTKELLLYLLFGLAGMLSKLPSAYILILLSVPCINSIKNIKRFSAFTLVSALCLSIVFYWYFVWVPQITEQYGFKHFFMGKSLSEGAKELLDHPIETLSKFYEVAIKFIAFAFFLLGMFFAFKLKNKLILYIFILGFLAFLPIMLKGGFTFYHHSYYIIPFVPIMALISGYGLSMIHNKRIATLILIAIGIEGFLNHIDDFRIKPEYKNVLELEGIMEKFSSRSDLITVNSGAFPTPVYFSHRKGWVSFNGELQTKSYTDSLRAKGLKYIVIIKEVFGQDVYLPYEEVYNDNHFRIYSLKND